MGSTWLSKRAIPTYLLGSGLPSGYRPAPGLLVHHPHRSSQGGLSPANVSSLSSDRCGAHHRGLDLAPIHQNHRIWKSLFLFTLLPTFKFLPFQAERYLYIPSIGLCYLAGLAFNWLYAQRRGIGRGLLVASVSVLVAFLGFSTWKRCEVWQDSESLWLSVVKTYPAYPAVHINLGHAYWSKGKLDAAIGAYQQALALQPDQVEALNNLGTAHAQKGALDAALGFFQRALAVKPDYVEAQGNLGSVYVKQGRLDETVSIYQEALSRKPDNPEILHNLGIVWHRKEI